MIKSNRELARQLGVSDTAVRKAEKAGRIQRDADGSWNLRKVSAQWNLNTDSTKRHAPSADGQKPVPATAINTVRETLQDGGNNTPNAGTTTYMQARTADMVLRAQYRKIELEQLKGTLVNKQVHDDKVFRLARQLRDMIQNWPSRVVPQMAAELGVDAHQLQVTLDRSVRELLGDIIEASHSID